MLCIKESGMLHDFPNLDDRLCWHNEAFLLSSLRSIVFCVERHRRPQFAGNLRLGQGRANGVRLHSGARKQIQKYRENYLKN